MLPFFVVFELRLFFLGYNWCIEIIKTSNLAWLASELELNKALVYLRQNDVSQAIETLQMHDKKSEESMTASALINLSFIYINVSIYLYIMSIILAIVH